MSAAVPKKEPLRSLPSSPRPTKIQRRSSSSAAAAQYKSPMSNEIIRRGAVKYPDYRGLSEQSASSSPSRSVSPHPLMKRILTKRVEIGIFSPHKSGRRRRTAKKPYKRSQLRQTVTVSPSGKIKEYNMPSPSKKKSSPSKSKSSRKPLSEMRIQPGWYPHLSRSTGKTYWYNPELKQSTYEMPLLKNNKQ